MHLFDGENGPTEWTQKAFWKVFGGVTGVTYLVAAVALMGVRKRHAVKLWLQLRAWDCYYALRSWFDKGLLALAMFKLPLRDRSARPFWMAPGYNGGTEIWSFSEECYLK